MTNKELLQKIDLVVDRLMNLGGADYSLDKDVKETDKSRGLIARDFGIEEWDWPQGVGLYGLSKLQSYYQDSRYLSFFEHWFARNMETGLPSKNINTTAPFLALLANLDALNRPEYGALCKERAQWLMDELPKTEEGGFQHVTSAIGDRNGVILNESEIWVDTLFMAVLFLSQAGRRFDRQDWVEESIHQMLLHIKYLYDPKSGLLYHGWNFKNRDHFGGIFWGRGNSWFTYGVIDYIDSFQGTMPQGLHRYLTDTYRSQVNALVALQAESGLWHTVLDDPDSYEEVSGSAAIAAGILKGVKSQILSPDFLAPAHKAIEGICRYIDADGTVLGVSAGTGIGMDAEHYKNVAVKPMAYGQSLTLLALIEALE